MHKGKITVDEEGRKSIKYVGEHAIVIVNPDTNRVITTWKTKTRIRKNTEMVNSMDFSKKQVEFMKSIGIQVDFEKTLSDEEYITIEEKISEHLQKKGFDKDYLPTQEGKICESILDML